MSHTLEDQSLLPPPPAGSGSGAVGAVQLSDLYAMDLKTIYNKSIFAFLSQYAMFYFDIDQMIFNAGDSDLVLAAKNTAVMMGTELASAQLRRAMPQLIL